MSWLGISIYLALVIVFLLLMRTMEPGWERWFRFLISLPLLLFSMVPTIFAPFFIAALAFVWGGRISHLLSGPITNMIYGRGSQSAGHIPNFKYARDAALDGEFEEAIKLTKWELAKQPDNYEGLILMATIYMETDRPKLALEQLDRIIASPNTPSAQRQAASDARLECLNAIR